MSERRNTTIGFMMSAVLIVLSLGSLTGSARSEAMYNVTYLAPFQYSVTSGTPSYLSYITNPALLRGYPESPNSCKLVRVKDFHRFFRQGGRRSCGKPMHPILPTNSGP